MALVSVAGRLVRSLGELKCDVFAQTQIIELDGRPWVLKRARTLAGLIRHERRVYRRLEGVPGVPALGPLQGPRFLTHAYVDGCSLEDLWQSILADRHSSGATRDEPFAPRIPTAFYTRLGAIVDAMHQRWIVHFDLAKRANILVDTHGHPHVIDFQLARDFKHEPSWPHDRLFDAGVRADHYQVLKHAARHRLPAPDWPQHPQGLLHRLHHSLLRNPWVTARRLF